MTAAISASVFNLASGAATPTPVTFANQRVGGSLSQALTVANTAPSGSFTEVLNASFGANTGPATNNGGSITGGQGAGGVAGGASNSTAMSVGLDTTTAGAKSGTVTLNYVSNGTGTSGLGNTSVGSQSINVSGNVYRLASPTVNTGSVTLAARVGDAAPAAAVSVTNSSPDSYTEGLKVSGISTGAPGFTTSGSIANLAAQGTDASSLKVKLSTAAAGTFSGQATVALASTGQGTTGAADFALPSQNVGLTGHVYTPAVGQASSTAVDFGIVHVGDTVTQALGVKNGAAVTALNDVLTGGFTSVTGPFTASGTLAGVAAQATDSSSLALGLNTAHAGSYSGTAALGLASHDAELSDQSLGSTSIALTGVVNNHALPVFTLGSGGVGSLTGSHGAFVLDLGVIIQGTHSFTDVIDLANGAIGPTDLLTGSFDLTGLTDVRVTGFTNGFQGLDAGQFIAGDALIDPSLFKLGTFHEVLTLDGVGYNSSGFREDLRGTLIIEGDIAARNVPEPESFGLMLLGGGLLAGMRLRRRYQLNRSRTTC